MQQPAARSGTSLAELDPTEQFAKRKRTSLWFTISLLVVAIFILTIGLAATTRSDNVTVGGYQPGIILGFGSFLGLIGINLVENRKQMLVASIVFISFGVVAAFCCAIVDGVFAARHIDPRPVYAGRCKFYSGGAGYIYDNYQIEISCSALSSSCPLKVKSNTCYCCDLYTCLSYEQISYFEYIGVNSCQDVVHLYRLLWTSTVLNIAGIFLGIITAAILGAFKDMAPVSPVSYNTTSPPIPQILYDPAQQLLTYAGLCPTATALPGHTSSYHLPIQHPSALSGGISTISEDTQHSSQSSSNCVLSPNAPPLYTTIFYSARDKPPPYAP